MLSSFSIKAELDVRNSGIFVYKVVCIDSEFILDFREPTLECWTLAIYKRRRIWNLCRLLVCNWCWRLFSILVCSEGAEELYAQLVSFFDQCIDLGFLLRDTSS